MWRLLATGMCFFSHINFFLLFTSEIFRCHFSDDDPPLPRLDVHSHFHYFTSTSMSQLSTTTGRHHDNDASTHHHKVRNRKLGSVCYIWIALRTLVFCSCLLVPWPCLPSSTGTKMWELAFNNLKTLLMTVFSLSILQDNFLRRICNIRWKRLSSESALRS